MFVGNFHKALRHVILHYWATPTMYRISREMFKKIPYVKTIRVSKIYLLTCTRT